MTKTPEQMAEEYLRYENESYYWAKHAFLAGYQAAKDETNLPTSAKWISVKKRLPDRDQEVLCYEKPFISTCLFWKSRSFLMEHQWELSNGRNCNPTHWMSLPKPPEVKE